MNNKTYNGNWANGKMNGKGKFTYPDGSYYEGEFINGKKCGFGLYKWENDKYYEGKWKNDKQNGFGIYHDKNKVIKGFWIDGKLKDRNSNNKIKRNLSYMIKNKKSNDIFDKKAITQENFYLNNNLTERKGNKKIHELNFGQTFFDKESKSNNFVNDNKNE